MTSTNRPAILTGEVKQFYLHNAPSTRLIPVNSQSGQQGHPTSGNGQAESEPGREQGWGWWGSNSGGKMRKRTNISAITTATRTIVLGPKQHFCATPKAFEIWEQRADGSEFRVKRFPASGVYWVKDLPQAVPIKPDPIVRVQVNVNRTGGAWLGIYRASGRKVQYSEVSLEVVKKLAKRVDDLHNAGTWEITPWLAPTVGWIAERVKV